MIETKKKTPQCILFGIINKNQGTDKSCEYLDELEFLATTAGMNTVKRFTQKLDKPDNKYFLGTGKLNEIKLYLSEYNIEHVIFDDELSPSQQRNLENELKVNIHDRTTLILKIFADRARTSYAKTQVELAQYQYLLPRLTRMWTHLDRIKGGIGMKGAGEKEIETDRRIIKEKIAHLKTKLANIDRQLQTQRKNRDQIVRVALIGYTNVGKSTIMNKISKSEVLAENKLFATLDTTVRKVVINDIPCLISDTVGFIRKLPTQLIESFKSTLDEARESDILIHVVDVSHPSYHDQIEVVNNTLNEIKVGEKPVIYVFNKVDKYIHVPKQEDDLSNNLYHNPSIEELSNYWFKQLRHPVVFISAIEKTNWETLKEIIYKEVRKIFVTRYPNYHLFNYEN